MVSKQGRTIRSRRVTDRVRMIRMLLMVGVVGATAVIYGCNGAGDETTPQSRDVRLLDFELSRSDLIRSSVLEVPVRPTRTLVADSAAIRFEGTLDGQSVDETFEVPMNRPTDTAHLHLEWSVSSTLWELFGGLSGAQFDGRVEVRLVLDGRTVARGAVDDVRLSFRGVPTPGLQETSLTGERRDVHVNERVTVQTSGLLSDDEGGTYAQIVEGELRPTAGEPRELDGERVAVEWAGSRATGRLRMDPAVFGVQTGEFDATVRLVNQPRLGSEQRGPNTHQLRGRIQPSTVAMLDPGGASRGGFVDIQGRGFVSSDADAAYGMVLRYEGTFVPRDGSPAAPIADAVQPDGAGGGSSTLERAPERVVAEDTIRQTVWYRVTEARELAGLGRRPGTFDGRITPVLFDAHGEQVGDAWEGEFTVEPTKQVMYVKFLPVFSRALEAYGLRNVERPIREKVLETIRDTYAGYHVEVTETRPTRWAAYATIEVGGADPTGTRAFGFDNSFNDVAKDTGNLFLADYLGGVNAEAAAEFNNPYGGIFLNSFSYFSAELNPDSPGSSDEFDRIFRPFMPALGGTPVAGDEWPDGPRTSAIRAAIDAIGHVVGNTAAHEFGHSMGMTFVQQDTTRPTDIFHNQISGPYLMDGGADRPFAERAELPGTQPAGFNERNRAYLDRIIPEP